MNSVSWKIFPVIVMCLFAGLYMPQASAGNKYHEENVAVNRDRFDEDFSWTADRKLQWSDFKGQVSDRFSHNTAAVTYCSFGFRSVIEPGNVEPKIEVFNLFHVNKSWSRCHPSDEEVLAHEQCHFDICELFTRILRARLENSGATARDMSHKLNSIYEEVRAEYIAFQEAYEAATHHGLIDAEQNKWEQLVAESLAGDANRPDNPLALREQLLPEQKL